MSSATNNIPQADVGTLLSSEEALQGYKKLYKKEDLMRKKRLKLLEKTSEGMVAVISLKMLIQNSLLKPKISLFHRKLGLC